MTDSPASGALILDWFVSYWDELDLSPEHYDRFFLGPSCNRVVSVDVRHHNCGFVLSLYECRVLEPTWGAGDEQSLEAFVREDFIG